MNWKLMVSTGVCGLVDNFNFLLQIEGWYTAQWKNLAHIYDLLLCTDTLPILPILYSVTILIVCCKSVLWYQEMQGKRTNEGKKHPLKFLALAVQQELQ